MASDQRSVQYFPKTRLHPAGNLPILDGEQRVEVSGTVTNNAILYTVPASKLFLLYNWRVGGSATANDTHYGLGVRDDGNNSVYAIVAAADDGGPLVDHDNFTVPIICYPDWDIFALVSGGITDAHLSYHGFEVDTDIVT